MWVNLLHLLKKARYLQYLQILQIEILLQKHMKDDQYSKIMQYTLFFNPSQKVKDLEDSSLQISK